MVKCPFCQATYVDNTVFCSECGNYLLQDDNRKTDPLDMGNVTWSNEIEDEPKLASSLQHIAKPQTIRFKIGDNKREVAVSLAKAIHIGRVDPSSNVFPEIDLTDYGILSKSVSRRHARILKQDSTIIVEDLASVNGTFINGKRLDPYLPETLSDGDTLHFGKLVVEVKFSEPITPYFSSQPACKKPAS